jgi:predicted nuclease of predicted toxin-antitoxin system
MRFAIDACVPAQLAIALRALGADVISAAGRPAMPDDEVPDGAVARDRVLVTRTRTSALSSFVTGKVPWASF